MNPIPFQTVDREDRIRQTYPEIDSLAEDILTHGLIHPLSITPDNKLIAGGRRSAALSLILSPDCPLIDSEIHPNIAQFQKDSLLLFGIHYTLRTVKDLAELSELELMENVSREQFTWQERCLSIDRIHNLNQQRNLQAQKPLWTQAHTGKLFGKSKTNVSFALQLAILLKDPSSELWKVPSATEALQLIAFKKQEAASKILAERIKSAQAPTITTPIVKEQIHVESQHSPSASSTPIFIDEFATASSPTSIPEPNIQKDHMATATGMVKHIDMVEYARKNRNSVDHIITDPPYGIDIENSLVESTSVDGTHDAQENVENFEPWLMACYKVLKENGWCVWFCSPENFYTIKEVAKNVGFKVQPWPFIWQKTGQCVNRQAQYNLTKNYECAVIMRKGDVRLIKPEQSSFWTGKMSELDSLRSKGHAFAKPHALWTHLYRLFTSPGQTVWDPFSGCGSSTLAALDHRLVVKACELEETHYVHQLENIVQYFKNLDNSLPF